MQLFKNWCGNNQNVAHQVIGRWLGLAFYHSNFHAFSLSNNTILTLGFRPGWHKAMTHSSIYILKNILLCWSLFPAFMFLKLNRALSISGVSIQPVSAQEPLLLSVQLCSGRLHIWRPSIRKFLWIAPTPPTHPFPCLKCYKKQSFLTFSFICTGWEQRHTVSPANHMMTAVISILKYETADHYH